MSERMKSLEESGLIGCLNDSEITSDNYKDFLPGAQDPESLPFIKAYKEYKIKAKVTEVKKGEPMPVNLAESDLET